jgi:hypothetical protein
LPRWLSGVFIWLLLGIFLNVLCRLFSLISLRTLQRDKTLRGLASSNNVFPAAGREVPTGISVRW